MSTSSWKREVHERDCFTCQFCGSKENPEHTTFQVHHIRFRCNGGGNELSNLMLLCPQCHANLHKIISSNPSRSSRSSHSSRSKRRKNRRKKKKHLSRNTWQTSKLVGKRGYSHIHFVYTTGIYAPSFKSTPEFIPKLNPLLYTYYKGLWCP